MVVPIAYLYWFSRIREWKIKKKKRELTEKEFKQYLFQWRIPKNLRYVIMKEMEKMGLISIEKKIVSFNDGFIFEEKDIKENFKDGDTKKGNLYLSKENL